MKPDERQLLEELRRGANDNPPATPRDVAAGMDMHPKRCLILCQAWWGRRWLERTAPPGRSLGAARADAFLGGRLTPAGMAANLDAY